MSYRLLHYCFCHIHILRAKSQIAIDTNKDGFVCLTPLPSIFCWHHSSVHHKNLLRGLRFKRVNIHWVFLVHKLVLSVLSDLWCLRMYWLMWLYWLLNLLGRDKNTLSGRGNNNLRHTLSSLLKSWLYKGCFVNR